ncbi:hypothetical protein HDU98_010667, partial [Podochytrium sp. JEL0797]
MARKRTAAAKAAYAKRTALSSGSNTPIGGRVSDSEASPSSDSENVPPARPASITAKRAMQTLYASIGPKGGARRPVDMDAIFDDREDESGEDESYAEGT